MRLLNTKSDKLFNIPGIKMSDEKPKADNTLLLVALFAILLSFAVVLNVSAGKTAGSTYEVEIGNELPSASGQTCCFLLGGEVQACYTAGQEIDVVGSAGDEYEILCNITVSDLNGYEDILHVNASWHRSNVARAGAQDNDNRYLNVSCNTAGSGSGNSITYQCIFENIKYWADAGNWNLSLNMYDTTGGPNDDTKLFTIGDLLAINQTTTIEFGSMALGENGSEGTTDNTVHKPAVTTNLGNTGVRMGVQANSASMSCTLGSIPLENIKYANSDSTSMVAICGALTDADAWGCANLDISDCSGACASPSDDTSYWGICIPLEGVSGTCSVELTFTAGAQL
jgi:hypothetical protein